MIESMYPILIYGPTDVMNRKFNQYIVIIPSKTGMSKGKLAKEIKSFFINNSEKELKKWVNLLSLDDIILCLPTGNSKIKSSF